jgi:hypothetical protein
MRGLPGWMLLVMIVLTAMLLYVGYEERHEAGWLPFVMGVVFALFTLAAMGGKARGGQA